MRLSLFLALLGLSTLPSRADEKDSLPQEQTRESPSPGPAPQLLHMERILMRKQEARDTGALPPEKYQEFAVRFRAELDAVMGRITPTPEDRGLHAQILARLGEQERDLALANIEQALEQASDSPALLVAKGSILYEQRDFSAADALARQAWEASGRKDERAWALHKMSEGRISGAPSGEPAPRLRPASDFARLEWSIPERHDINDAALGLIQQATAARRRQDMVAAEMHIQAAMNADPASKAMQDFYREAKAGFARHAEAKAYLDQAVAAAKAGRRQDALAWMQRHYDSVPNDSALEALQVARQRTAEEAVKRAAEPAKAPAPKRGLPPWAPLAPFGTGLAGYGLYRLAKSRDGQASGEEDGDYRGPPVAKRAWSEQEFDKPQSSEEDLERVARNRYKLKVAAVSAVIGFGVVYGGPVVWRAATPVVAAVWRTGTTSLQRVTASEAGAIFPEDQLAAQRVAAAFRIAGVAKSHPTTSRFFEGTRYSDAVLKEMKRADFHAFPEIVRNYASHGEVVPIRGGDGITRIMLRIPGSYQGKPGVFEFIKEPNGLINHRFFRPIE